MGGVEGCAGVSIAESPEVGGAVGAVIGEVDCERVAAVEGIGGELAGNEGGIDDRDVALVNGVVAATSAESNQGDGVGSGGVIGSIRVVAGTGIAVAEIPMVGSGEGACIVEINGERNAS